MTTKLLTTFLIIALLSTFNSSISFAQNKSKNQKKKQTVGELLNKISLENRGSKVSIEKNNTTIQGGQLNLSPRKSNMNLEDVKPPKSSKYLDTDMSERTQLEKITEEQIKELYKLTRKFQNSPNRGELWLRLAELYVEKAALISFRNEEIYDEQLKDFQAGKRKSKPSLNLSESREYNRKAIQLYGWFERDFPKDKKMDQVLFFLGYNYYEINELQKGTQYYTTLTQKYPKSTFVTEANFALAEFYFENDKWDQAYKYYLNVTKDKNHRLLSFALYKTSWCLFRLGKQKQALSLMEKLILSSRNEKKSSSSKFRLESEGLRDIVVFYGEAGDPNQAESFFKELAGEQNAYSYVEKLAYYYADKGYRENAMKTFRSLIQMNPASPKAFDYQYQIVSIYAYASKSKAFKDALYAWIREFGEDSLWYKENSKNKDLIDNSNKLRETTLRNYILQEHQTAQNSRAAFSQTNAYEGYRLYFEEFEKFPTAGDMHFFFAELVYDMKKYDEAAFHYRVVVEKYAQSKYYNQSSINAVLSYEKGLPTDEQLRKKVGNSVERFEFDDKVRGFVEIGQWYLSKFASSEKAPEIKFRMGRLHYLHNQFDEASNIFKEIVQKYPKTKYAEYSANLLLDIYNLRQDYEGLEKAGNELLAMQGISGTKTSDDIRGVLEKSSFKKAQDLEAKKDFKASAEQFELFAKQNPKSDLAISALFNAGVNYERVGLVFPAVLAYNSILKSKDPQAEKLKPKSRRLAAKLYQDLGYYDEAADAFYFAAKESPTDPLSPNLYFNAGVLYAALSKYDKSIESYNAYYNSSKGSDRREALFDMGTVYKKQGALSKSIEKFQEYIASNPASREKLLDAHYEIYKLYRKLGRKTETENWQKKLLSIQSRFAPNKKGLGATYAAEIKFEGVLKKFEEFKALKIPNDPKAQQAAAQKKISSLSSLNNEIVDVVKYDSAEEIVSGLTVAGQANLHMYQVLMSAPMPKDLNEEEKKQYKEGIEKIATPFLEKSKESFKAAVERGWSLETYNDSYRLAQIELKRLSPDVHYDRGEKAFETQYVNWLGL